MNVRTAIAAAILATIPLFGVAFAQESPDTSVPHYWRTWPERTQYRETADYEGTVRYIKQLDGASAWIDVQDLGTSGQGRPMPLIVVSRDRVFTPEGARASGKPIVLVLCGIHAGEVSGKDASLELLRDMTVFRKNEALLDSVTLLIVPMLSIDAHDRRSATNRITQSGPEQAGWRYNPVGLNLNRDWMKAETVELRALLSEVITRWWPHLLIDTHTTNGADYQHDVTYDYGRGPVVPRAIEQWTREAFEQRVIPRLREMGHLPAPYMAFKEPHRPESGIDANAFRPRYSNTYGPLQCMPGILVETHSFKPYEVRVRAVYDMLLAMLEEVHARPQELMRACADARSEVVLGGPRPIALTSRLSGKRDSIDFHGYEVEWYDSDIAGRKVARYTREPTRMWIPYWRDTEPDVSVQRPAGYFVPREWGNVRETLELHGVQVREFAQAWRDTVEVQRLTGWWARSTSYEGHRPINVTDVRLERVVRPFRAGDLWVPLDQRTALVAIHLLEARAPDGLMHWNAFDTILERKQYAEDYVMEPIASGMLAADPELAREFRAMVEADTAFANDPKARLDWFYRRSKWADPEYALVPVARALRAPPESVIRASK